MMLLRSLFSSLLSLASCQSCHTPKNPPRNPQGPTPATKIASRTVDKREFSASTKPARFVATYRLNDEINEESVKAAIAQIDAAESAGASAFLLELNTPGGSVDDGFELAKKIENAKVPITCVVDGKAASMGAFILESCPVRVITKRSMIMFHEPSLGGMFHGRPNEWEAVAQALQAARDAMAEHCCHRLTISLKEYHERTDGGKMWWVLWDEGLKVHAVDRVVVSVNEVLATL